MKKVNEKSKLLIFEIILAKLLMQTYVWLYVLLHFKTSVGILLVNNITDIHV